MDHRIVETLATAARHDAVTLRVRGGCMEPLIADGAAVPVRRRRVYWPGDVLVFRTPAGDLAAHRLVGYRRRGFVTKGDHCDLHDAPVRREAVVGAVEGVSIGVAARLCAMATFLHLALRKMLR